MLFQTCTKLTFGLSDVFVVTVIARNRINGVGSLFFRDRVLRFGENMPQSLKRFFEQLVAIQNSLDGFCNTLNVRNNSKTAGSLSSRVLLVVTGFWQLRRKVFVWPFAFKLKQFLSEYMVVEIEVVDDLTESIIHSHWRLIYVRRFTSVYEVNGEESYCISRFNFFLLGLWQYGACVLLVRVLSSQQIPVHLHQLWNIV